MAGLAWVCMSIRLLQCLLVTHADGSRCVRVISGVRDFVCVPALLKKNDLSYEHQAMYTYSAWQSLSMHWPWSQKVKGHAVIKRAADVGMQVDRTAVLWRVGVDHDARRCVVQKMARQDVDAASVTDRQRVPRQLDRWSDRTGVLRASDVRPASSSVGQTACLDQWCAYRVI